MADFEKNCNFEIEEPHCNSNKDRKTVTVLPAKMKSYSCGIMSLLISINTVLALTGIILGTFAITRFQQMEISMASAITRFQQMENSMTYLQKRSSFSEENSNTEIQSQLIDEVITKASIAFSRVISSGKLTGPQGNIISYVLMS